MPCSPKCPSRWPGRFSGLNPLQSARLGFEQAQKANDAEAVRTFGTLYAATLNPTEQEGEVRLVTETMKRYSKAAPAVPAEDSELLELDE